MDDRKGEDASAATEFAVLLPVYMLLFISLFTLGQLMLVRQKIVLAARLQAWLNHQQGNIGTAMFGGFASYGSYSGQLSLPQGLGNQSDYGANPADFKKAYDNERQARLGNEPAPSDQQAEDAASQLAAAVWDDAQVQGNQAVPRVHLEWRGATASFSYLAPWMPTFFHRSTAITPSGSCYVLGRRLADQQGTPLERKVYRPNAANPDPSGRFVGDHHPIEDLADRYMFSISKPTQGGPNGGQDFRFFPPELPSSKFQNEQGVTLQPQNITSAVPQGSTDTTNPGIWNTGLRIGGDADQEHSFFQQKLGL